MQILRPPSKPFLPVYSALALAGKVIGASELKLMVDASLGGWLTTARFNTIFEKRLSALKNHLTCFEQVLHFPEAVPNFDSSRLGFEFLGVNF